MSIEQPLFYINQLIAVPDPKRHAVLNVTLLFRQRVVYGTKEKYEGCLY